MTFDELINTAAARRASDIHLRAGHAPLVRIHGELQRWSSVAALTAGHLDAIADRLLPPVHKERLQTKLEVAHFRHSEKESPAEIAASVEKIRRSNFIFAGPGSPTYAVKHWQGSPVWDAVTAQFEQGADLFFASAASITMGRYALPVYEIYKAGDDPFWADGLDMLGTFGITAAVVPHYNDNSGGDNSTP